MENKIMEQFSWKLYRKKALLKKLERSIDLTRCNPDYQIAHPKECQDNPDHKRICHPDAIARIEHQHQKIVNNSIIPQIKRPRRFNRLVPER